MKLYEIENIANINYGTRVVKKRDSGTIYDVYGGGGKTFKVDSFNRENCVIVSRFGMSEECVRRVDGKFFLNDSGLSVETKDPNVVIQKYIDWFLFSKMFDIYLLGRGTAQKNLDVDKFRLIKIPVPSLQEQEKIVKKLDNILESTKFEINSNMQKKEKIDYFYNSFLNSIFNNRNFKFTDLGNLCDLIGGGTPSKQNESFYEGDIPWATVGDMQDIEVSDTRLKINKDAIKNSSTKVIPSGNIIIATRVGLGKVSKLLVDTAINQDLKGVIPKIKKNIDEKFLLFWFQSKSNHIISAGTGATVQGVKLPFVRSLKIPILDIETQKHIGDKAETVFKSCEYLKNIYLTKVSLYETLRKSVLNEAFEIKNDE